MKPALKRIERHLKSLSMTCHQATGLGERTLGLLFGFLFGLLLFQSLRRFLLGFFLNVSTFAHGALSS